MTVSERWGDIEMAIKDRLKGISKHALKLGVGALCVSIAASSQSAGELSRARKAEFVPAATAGEAASRICGQSSASARGAVWQGGLELTDATEIRIASEWQYLPADGTVRLLAFQPFDKDIAYRVFVMEGYASKVLASTGPDVNPAPVDTAPSAASAAALAASAAGAAAIRARDSALSNSMRQEVLRDTISAQAATTGAGGTDFLATADSQEPKTLITYQSDLVERPQFYKAWSSNAKLIVVGCNVAAKVPKVYGTLVAPVSYVNACRLFAIFLCVAFYIFAASTTFYIRRKQRMATPAKLLALGAKVGFFARRSGDSKTSDGLPVTGTNYASFWEHLDPVVLTAGANGRGSATKLQILFFSIIVFGLMSYIWMLTGHMSGLSENVLLLMGISGFGATAAAGTDMARNRLEFTNWAWLVQNHWLPKGGVAEENMAKWNDIFATDGEFDVFRFQMVTFSFMVGMSLLGFALRVNDLSNFELPSALLGILGLSQVVYVAGKLVTPPSVADLNDQLTKLQEAEKQLRVKRDAASLSGVYVVVAATSETHDALVAYDLYLKTWTIARTMFESTLGRLVPKEADNFKPPFQMTPLMDDSAIPLPNAASNEAYSLQLGASGGVGPYAWSTPNAKELPPGLTLSATGLVSGTVAPGQVPGGGKAYTFQVEVTDKSPTPVVVCRRFTISAT